MGRKPSKKNADRESGPPFSEPRAGEPDDTRIEKTAEPMSFAVTSEDALSTALQQLSGIAEAVPLTDGEAEGEVGSSDEASEQEATQPVESRGEPPTARSNSESSPVPIGAIDEVTPERIIGWAWQPRSPNEPIDVRILVDDTLVTELLADQFRPELMGRIGDGRHGFAVQDLAAHMPPGTHSVRVRRANDGLDLPGSPSWVTRPDEPDDVVEVPVSTVSSASQEPLRAAAPAIGNVDVIEHDRIAGWAWNPANPDEPIELEILDGDLVVLTVRADQFRADLVGKIGNGIHGFDLRNLAGVFPLSRHLVRVRRAGDGLDLPGSPHWITRPGLDAYTIDFMEQAVFSAVQVATDRNDLAQPLSTLLQLLNDLVNAHDGLKSVAAPTAIELASGLNLVGRTQELVSQLRYTHPPLWFEPGDKPTVSIVIPVFNNFTYTYDCLKSITTALPERSFEIVIVDDCSDDETLFGSLVFTGAVRIMRNTGNQGFVRSCNAGAAAAKGRYLLFLNNDTLMKPGWLDELVETFEQVPNVGIVGSRLLYPDGSLQEAGGIIWRLGDAWNWGRGGDPNEPSFSFLRDTDYVSGAALMIEHALFEELGGFDELFAPAYYEDTDLCFRVRARGKRVVVQSASEIVHLEGISAGTDTAGSGMKRYQAINHAKFYRRWKDGLITHRLNGQEPELEAERLVHKRAYFIDDTVPTPDQDAGSNAALDHMRLLMELGYKVTFLPGDNMAKIDPYTRNLQKTGIECLYYPTYWSVEEVFRKARHKPDLVYLHRYTNASKYAMMVRRYFPDCHIVYCVADLHFLRMERQASLEGGGYTAAAAQRRTEIAAMQSVDYVIVHSPAEAAMLHELDPQLRVGVVPWTVRPRPTPLAFENRSGTAFVGGFGHPPNGDAVGYLVSDILPLLRQQAPECTTYLIGSNMPGTIMRLNQPGLRPLGFVPVLADMLHKLRCTIVPLRYGAGIKGKVLESFAHGLPCVMSQVAAEGLELPEELAWLIAGSPEAFADKVRQLHSDADLNERLAGAGLQYIAERNSSEVVKRALEIAVNNDVRVSLVAG